MYGDSSAGNLTDVSAMRMLDAFACAVTRQAIISYTRSVYRRLESTSRDLVPSVSQPLEIIQHTGEFDRPFSIGVAMPGTEEQIREAASVREDAVEYLLEVTKTLKIRKAAHEIHRGLPLRVRPL